MSTISPLQQERLKYRPKLPVSLRNGIDRLELVKGENTESAGDREQIKNIFPNTYGKPVVSFKASQTKRTVKPRNVGVILSGGQAPGGHNVIAGLYDALKHGDLRP